MSHLLKINRILEQWASFDPPIRNFTVSNVLSTLGLSEQVHAEVLEILMRKNGLELYAKLMMFCPNGHKGKTFPITQFDNRSISVATDDPDEEFTCLKCGQSYHMEPHNSKIVFSFASDYLSEAQKKNKRRDRPLSIGTFS